MSLGQKVANLFSLGAAYLGSDEIRFAGASAQK